MAVETDDERAIFFGVDDFGSAASVTINSTTTQVAGIFDDDYQDVDAGGMVGFATSSPTFHARTSDLTGIEEGDTLTVNAQNFVVRVVMDDGTGLTMLQLERQ